MKDIKTYLLETKIPPHEKLDSEIKDFELSKDERDQLCEIVGYASGALGKDEDVNKFEDFRKSLSKQELEDLDNLFNTLDNEQTYHKFTSKIMTDEDINICLKLFHYLSDIDEWDLSELADTIGLPY